MKKKIRIKKLPKAQVGQQVSQPPLVLTPQQQDIWRQNQTTFWGTPPEQIISVPDNMGSTNTTPPLPTGQPLFPNTQTQTQSSGPAPVYTATGPATATTPGLPPSGPELQMDPSFKPNASQVWDVNNIPQQLTQPEPEAPSSQFKRYTPFIAAGIFGNLGRRREERQQKADFRNRFLSDNTNVPIPVGYSGIKGDYTLNQGLGINFRPDEGLSGQFGKVVKYGGQMKRTIKITGLPQQAYGGTQTRASIDEMYPTNSNVRRAEYSNLLEGNPDNQVKQYIEEVPREYANIEAERGETIIKPNDEGSLNMFKIGGKRHYEGGTPLRANENDFIFSDTKAMKIKDPAILESFGMKLQKKGSKGYTPAEISKKFNLNDPSIQHALNDPKADRMEKITAERLYDNYLSQLGKLALIQEGKKGFPQGAPSIAMPYMQKIGLDPSMFMPQVMQPQDAYFQMGKAQVGGSAGNQITAGAPPSWTEPTDFMRASIPLSAKARQQMENEQVNQIMQRGAGSSMGINSTGSSSAGASAASNDGTLTSSQVQALPEGLKKYMRWDSSRNKYRLEVPSGLSTAELTNIARAAEQYGISNMVQSGYQRLKGPASQYEGFYGGLTPQDFERKIVAEVVGEEGLKGLDETGIRKKAFELMGVDTTGLNLSDAKALYNDINFRKNTLYPAFKKYLPQAEFRKDLKDDFRMGFEHYDAIRGKDSTIKIPDEKIPPLVPPVTPTPTPGKIPPVKPPQDDPRYYIQDMNNTALALGDRLGIKKYMPMDANVPAPVLMDPTFYDPSREIAATNEMANIGAQNLAQFTGPQSFNARFTGVQGNAAKNVANTLGRYNNLNVGVANQFEQLNKGLINQYNLAKAKGKSDYYDKITMTNQDFDNSKRKADARLIENANSAITNRAKTQVLNTLYPNYNIDPTTGGTLSIDPNSDPYADITGSPMANNDYFSPEYIDKERAKLNQLFPNAGNEEIDKKMLNQYMQRGRGQRRSNRDQYYNNYLLGTSNVR